MTPEKRQEYITALEKEIDHILERKEVHSPIRCYVGKVHKGDCRNCELCPQFIPENPYPDAPEGIRPTRNQLVRGLHPCRHVPYIASDPNEVWHGFKLHGRTLFELNCWLETGMIKKVEFNIVVHRHMVNMLIMMHTFLLQQQSEEKTKQENQP